MRREPHLTAAVDKQILRFAPNDKSAALNDEGQGRGRSRLDQNPTMSPKALTRKSRSRPDAPLAHAAIPVTPT